MFLFVVGECGPPQPLGWLVPIFCCCHHEDFIGEFSFYGEHALAYPKLQFSDMSGLETKASPTIFEKCGRKLAREGKDATDLPGTHTESPTYTTFNHNLLEFINAKP